MLSHDVFVGSESLRATRGIKLDAFWHKFAVLNIKSGYGVALDCQFYASMWQNEANLRPDKAVKEVSANCIMGIRHSELSKGSRYEELFLGFVVSCQYATVHSPSPCLPVASADKQVGNKKWIYLMLRNSTVWKKWADK